MIRDLLARVGGAGADAESVSALRAEIERLEAQNDKLRRAMRQCIDCEYRIEVIGRRTSEGLAADGGDVEGLDPDNAGSAD
ncbi:MAG: hypothetical protein GY812_13610 [Actinomycetia bacterium]|nr:hypothetical protein [Actinomycetes bacterium]